MGRGRIWRVSRGDWGEGGSEELVGENVLYSGINQIKNLNGLYD